MIHLEPVTDVLVFWLRLYDGVPDDAPAFHHRLDFDLTGLVLWSPLSNCATVKGVKGQLRKSDVLDFLEKLYEELEVDFVQWERAAGKVVKKRRTRKRVWMEVKE